MVNKPIPAAQAAQGGNRGGHLSGSTLDQMDQGRSCVDDHHFKVDMLTGVIANLVTGELVG